MNLIQGGHYLAQLVVARKIVGVIGGVGGLQMLWCRRGPVAGGGGPISIKDAWSATTVAASAVVMSW